MICLVVMEGQHSTPKLFVAKGRLIDVLREAVAHPRFWTWGGGGNIKPYVAEVIEIIEVDKP